MKKDDLILIAIIVTVIIVLLIGAFIAFKPSGGGNGSATTTTSGDIQSERVPARVVQQTISGLSSSGIPTDGCDSVVDTNIREQCYIYNAVRSKSSAPCESIKSDELKKYTCYVSVASVLSDERLCSNVPDNGWRNYCMRGVANSNN